MRPRTLDRRTFLRAAGAVAVAGSAAGAGLRLRELVRPEARPWDPARFPPPGTARVAVLAAPRYGPGLDGLLVDGLRAIEARVSGARVLLKPNFVEYDPGRPITTDPRLVAASVLALRRLGAAEVVVGEAPGHRRDLQDVVSRSGLLEALGAVDARFIDLNTEPVRRVEPGSWYTRLGELWLPASVADADVVVSMPKLKTHHWAGVTLSLKNCFGCLPGRIYGWPKNVLHWMGIEPSILDVAAAVRPTYAIVDGIVGMEGNGPISGSAVPAGVLVVGDDPVATDVVAAGLMGVDARDVAYLVEAGRFLGQADPERIEQRGEEPARLARAFAPAPTASTAGRTG